MSIWMSVWRVGSSRSTFSSAVSCGPSLVPTASTTSAPPTISLALGQPKLPITPAASGSVSSNTPLPLAVVTTGASRVPGQGGQRAARLADAHAVAGDDHRARGAVEGGGGRARAPSLSTASDGRGR